MTGNDEKRKHLAILKPNGDYFLCANVNRRPFFSKKKGCFKKKLKWVFLDFPINSRQFLYHAYGIQYFQCVKPQYLNGAAST